MAQSSKRNKLSTKNFISKLHKMKADKDIPMFKNKAKPKKDLENSCW